MESKVPLRHESALHLEKLGLWDILQRLYPNILRAIIYLNSIVIIGMLLWNVLFSRYSDGLWPLLGMAIVFVTFRSIVGTLGRHDLKPLKKSKKYLKVTTITDKCITIGGSILVIFLSLLALFNTSANQQFLSFLDATENISLMTAIALFQLIASDTSAITTQEFLSLLDATENISFLTAIMLFLVFCYGTILVFLYDFLYRKTSSMQSDNLKELAKMLPLLIFSVAYFGITYLLISRYENILYWLFGFSLLGLHGFYLFNELMARIQRVARHT